MEDELELERDRKVSVNIVGEMRTSFLDYSMSVIVARAIPDVRDGLKPVHRRILYTLYEEGMTPDKKYQKSANAVGAVMGHYHPHGDAAIYDSMVRMAQDFTYRHTLVDGHGNFGSIDGDGAAASRYTEARLAKISMELLRDLNKDTVDFSENYDGQRKEPVVLPSRFPNILVNGNMGIAVGMATNIPPHNLGEVIDGCIAYIDNPDIDTYAQNISDYSKHYPYLVAVDENDKILGYVCGHPFRPHDAYKWNVESTIILSKDAPKRSGIATKLYEEFFRQLKERGYKFVYAVICDNNEASIMFHEALGFKKAGHLENAGYKLGKWIGVYFYVLQIDTLETVREPF